MPDYDLYRLGDRNFEKVITSLSVRTLGASVTVFGDGPDGGREATYRGVVDWSNTVLNDEGRWDGYCVIQAKFRVKRAAEVSTHTSWLKREIKKEIAKWVDDAGKRRNREVPDYFIFATNAELSGVHKSGGIDQLSEFMDQELKPLERYGLKDWRIWHSDQIEAMLDNAEEVRRAFSGLVTVGDVLASIAKFTGVLSDADLAKALRIHGLQCHNEDKWVRFSESGASDGSRAAIDEVAIDLPLESDGLKADDELALLRYAINHLNVARTSIGGQEDNEPANLVILGAPGQGKSTISQYLCHLYRAEFLAAMGDLDAETKDHIQTTRTHSSNLGLPQPVNRRWAIRVDLARYAERIGSDSDLGLLRWIAETITKRGSHDVRATDLESWINRWPSLVVLDGLDEVASQHARDNVLKRIGDFNSYAIASGADLVLIVTSRPVGYNAALPPFDYRHLQLARLTPLQALEFANRLSEVRLAEDPQMRSLVRSRLKDASEDPGVKKLMQTPLQVTIMSLIVERFPRLPPDRYGLFGRYYDTIYEREVAKSGHVGKLLNDYRVHVDRIHEHAGLLLQTKSEQGDGSDSHMSESELHELAIERLQAAGFAPHDLERLAREIVSAATTRLVLLVPRNAGLGFEVRSLQELMAGKAISNGGAQVIVENFRALAHSPHWRNTWLLGAGRVFSQREELVTDVLSLLEHVDLDVTRLGRFFPTGPALAAHCIDDNFARTSPLWQTKLLAIALDSLQNAPFGDPREIAVPLARACEDPAHRKLVLGKLADAARGNELQAVSALNLAKELIEITHGAGPVGKAAQQVIAKTNLSSPQLLALEHWREMRDMWQYGIATAHENKSVTSIGRQLRQVVADLALGLSAPETAKLEAALSALDGVLLAVQADGTFDIQHTPATDFTPVLTALEDSDLATLFEMVLEAVPAKNWLLLSVLGSAIQPHLSRRAVGPALASSSSGRKP